MTELPVLFTLWWAIWDAPVSVWQYVSLLGSCLLVLAGFVSVFHRRVAARIAVVAVTAIWCFYPAVAFAVHASLTVQVVRWNITIAALCLLISTAIFAVVTAFRHDTR